MTQIKFRNNSRRATFWGIMVFLVLCFVTLQFIAVQYFLITGFKLIVCDIFLVVFLAASGIVTHYYTLWPLEYQREIESAKEKGIADWKIKFDAQLWVKQEKFGRGCAFICMWFAAYWIIATVISQDDFGLLLFFALISIGAGLTQQQNSYPFYCIYLFCLPLVMMFLGTWCHFEPLLPVGAIMIPINIGSIILYHFLVKKYL